MKVIYFIKWMWRRFLAELNDWEHWQWGTIVTMFFLGGAMIGPKNAYSEFCAKMLVIIGVFYWACYVVIFKSLQRAWIRFNEEQAKILNHLKDSE